MRAYPLKIRDFIYPKEISARIITLTAAAVILIIFTIINIYVGLVFLLGMALLFLELYKNQMSTLGSCVRVGPNQFPEVYNLAQIAAGRLDMDMPPVYIMQSPVMNAFATGFWGNYFVVLHSCIVDALTEEELLATIGHEFTHIKGNHVIITNLAAQGIGAGQIMWWLQLIIKYIFMYLLRCQEYTCDRGGLIACGSIQAVVTENAKFSIGKELYSKINIMEFYRQVLELDKKPLGILGELEATHPLTVKRIREAVRFYRSDKYRRIAAMQGKMGTSTLQGSLATGDLMEKIVGKGKGNEAGYKAPSPVVSHHGLCMKCGTPKKPGSRFCVSCGAPYDSIADVRQREEIANNNFIPVPGVNESFMSPSAGNEGFIPVVEEREIIHVQSEDDGSDSTGGKICPQCGAANPYESVFCTECGEKI